MLGEERSTEGYGKTHYQIFYPCGLVIFLGASSYFPLSLICFFPDNSEVPNTHQTDTKLLMLYISMFPSDRKSTRTCGPLEPVLNQYQTKSKHRNPINDAEIYCLSFFLGNLRLLFASSSGLERVITIEHLGKARGRTGARANMFSPAELGGVRNL